MTLNISPPHSAKQGVGRPRKFDLDFSLFTGKARSYLRKKGIPFEEINVRFGKTRNFIIKRTGVKFIPVVHTPDTPKQKLVSLLLELYADEWLFIPALHYRWHYIEEQYHYLYNKFGAIIWGNAPGKRTRPSASLARQES